MLDNACCIAKRSQMTGTCMSAPITHIGVIGAHIRAAHFSFFFWRWLPFEVFPMVLIILSIYVNLSKIWFGLGERVVQSRWQSILCDFRGSLSKRKNDVLSHAGSLSYFSWKIKAFYAVTKCLYYTVKKQEWPKFTLNCAKHLFKLKKNRISYFLVWTFSMDGSVHWGKCSMNWALLGT